MSEKDVGVGSILLSPDLAEVSRGRVFVSQIAREAGFSDERVFDITVACSEAMANAIEHSPVKGEVEVKTILYPDRLEISVEGPGEFQAPDRLGGRTTRGLGLPLMAKLSDHLALFSGPAGQTFVSLTFYLPGHRPKGHDAVPPAFRNLSEEDRLLDDVLRHLPDGFFVFDADWRIIYLNPTVLARLERLPTDLLGTTIWEALPALSPDARNALESVKASGVSARTTVQTSAGSRFELTMFPVTEGVAVFSRDITEQQRADEAARESEERYRLLFEGMLDGFAYCQMLYDEDGRPDDFVYLAVNDRFAELTGLRDVVGKRVTEVVPSIKEATPEVFEIYGRVAGGGDPERFEIDFTPLAKWLFISVSSPAQGYFVAVFEDITERKQAEEALRESEERFRSMFEGHAVPMLLIEPQSGRISDANEAASRFYGYSPDQLRTMNIAEINELPPEEVAAERRKAIHLRQNDFIFRHRLADATVRFVEVHSSPVTINGQPMLFSVILDITERQRAEEALRESEERYRTIVETANEGIIMVDLEGRLRFVNQRFAEMLGYRPDELVGRHSFDLLIDRASAQSRFDRRLEGSSESYEFQYRRRDGSSFWAMVTGAPLRDREGHVIGAVGMVTDIDERKRAEEALRGSEERYRLLAEDTERLYRQQLDIAESLQLALLNIPSEMGPVRLGHLYRSATKAAQVGGDFYDAFEVKGNNIAMMVGDVAGHGIEAARTATLVKDVAHAFIHQSLRPHQVLRRTNTLLLEKNLPGFVSLFLAVLDIETGLLRYASAGHPETLLRRSSNEIQMLGTGAPPLGILPGTTWKTSDIYLEPGDLLLLYTDGVIETRRDGQFFGQKRLERLLKRKRVTVERLPHLILDQLLAFSHGSLSDDVAVLAVSYTREPTIAAERPD